MRTEAFRPSIDNERIINARIYAAGIQIVSLGYPDYPAFPVVLSGDARQISALLNLIYWQEKTNSLGIINLANLPNEVDPSLIEKLNKNEGTLVVDGCYKATTVIFIESDESGGYIFRYGYSQKGTSIRRSYNPIKERDRKISVETHEEIYQATLESLARLIEITRSWSYVQALISFIRNTDQVCAVDLEGYYAMLGLDPYALKFMSCEEFIARVNAIRKALAKLMHPDVNRNPTTYNRFAMLMKACDILGKIENLMEYSVWMQDTHKQV